MLASATSTGSQSEGVNMTTAPAETESAVIEPFECWCCGGAYAEPQLIRLGSHPEARVA
jgi:hypothetical protein